MGRPGQLPGRLPGVSLIVADAGRPGGRPPGTFVLRLWGGVDRTLGLVFGLARGAAVIIMIAYIMAGKWYSPSVTGRMSVLNARTAVADGLRRRRRWVREQLPEDYRPRLYAPPPGRVATADDLLHASPQGRATGKPPARD